MKKVIKNGIISILLIFLYLFIVYFPVIIIKLVSGINILELSNNFKIIYQLSIDIIFMFSILFIYRKDMINDFKNYYNKNILNNLETSLKYWGVGFVIMVVSNLILALLSNGGTSDNQEAIINMVKIAPIYMGFNTCIYAPLLEEIIFRKSIRKITDNKIIYVLLSGLVFGGLHVILNDFTLFDLLYIIPYSSLGLAFACCYYKTDNIFSTITMHMIHNTLGFIMIIISIF